MTTGHRNVIAGIAPSQRESSENILVVAWWVLCGVAAWLAYPTLYAWLSWQVTSVMGW